MKTFRLKEPFCALSHAAGAMLSLVGLGVLIVASRGRPLSVAVFSLYGASLFALYGASALYHALEVSPRATRLLQRCDHSAIFLLIAGSYAPICLLALPRSWGLSLLGAVCVIAIIGIALSFSNAPDGPRVALYLIMGWVAIIAFAPLRAALPTAGFAWLLSGGMLYSIGAAIFATNRPHLWRGRFSAHDLWHVFVLGGSACHFIVMLFFVARR